MNPGSWHIAKLGYSARPKDVANYQGFEDSKASSCTFLPIKRKIPTVRVPEVLRTAMTLENVIPTFLAVRAPILIALASGCTWLSTMDQLLVEQCPSIYVLEAVAIGRQADRLVAHPVKFGKFLEFELCIERASNESNALKTKLRVAS